MAKIKAFSCIRPKKGLEKQIAALPYDVYNREEAKAVVEREPYSFLQIDRAETTMADDIATYDERVYQKANDLLWEMIEKGELVQEEKPCYYLYEQIMNGRSQTGLVACSAVDDYLNGVIKKHENTRADKEQDRINHVNICNAQTGPIFLAYRYNKQMAEFMQEVKQRAAMFSFVAADGITHQAWRIDEGSEIEKITAIFDTIDYTYIADGHHRAASAVAVSKMRREENPSYTGAEEFNYFLSVLFADEELYIMDYNRIVTDLNDLTEDTFLAKVSKKFTVEKYEKPYKPEQKGNIGMYLNKEWYKLTVKSEYENKDPVEGLDVSILQKELLTPILGIGDIKIDKRIDFVGGIRGLAELERRVAVDAKVAFAMYPTAISELFAVADSGRLMPPKSTWFEPKLRSGLFIHKLV